MSKVEVRDNALWATHIQDNEPLKNRIIMSPQGSLFELTVDGWRGIWIKMDDGTDGRPTPGLKCFGTAKIKWHELQGKRGTFVSIEQA